MIEYGVLPLASVLVNKNAIVKSLLLFGGPHTGKTLLVSTYNSSSESHYHSFVSRTKYKEILYHVTFCTILCVCVCVCVLAEETECDLYPYHETRSSIA